MKNGLTSINSIITEALADEGTQLVLALLLGFTILLIVTAICVKAEKAARETARRQRLMHPDPAAERDLVNRLFDHKAVKDGLTYDIVRLQTLRPGTQSIADVEWLYAPDRPDREEAHDVRRVPQVQ